MNFPQITVLAVVAIVVTLLWRRVFPPPVMFPAVTAVLAVAAPLSLICWVVATLGLGLVYGLI